MMLTPRASKYLSGLARRPHTSLADVQASLRDQNLPCFSPWLDFHDRYAGYVEVIGRDQAVWGITHIAGNGVKPGIANVDKEPHEDRWYVTCAAVHPSYNYLLDDRGEFLGHPAESFDIKVERDALVHELASRGKVRRLSSAQARSPGYDRVLELTRQMPVKAASDKYFRYFASDTCVLAEDIELDEVSEFYLIDPLDQRRP